MLGKKLKNHRIKIMNLTLKDAAKKVGLSAVYVSEIEKGFKNPRNGKTLNKLAIGYGLELEDILIWLLEDIRLEVLNDD